MLILSQNAPPLDAPEVIPLFGVGLLGSSIREALHWNAPFDEESLDLSWTDPRLQAFQLAAIERRIGQLLTSGGKASPGTLKIVWSAGRAGFSATEEQIEVELESFRAVLRMVESLGQTFPEITPTVYVLSSLGGLFEDCRHIHARAPHSVLRPYGALKQRQEEALASLDARIIRKVYRVSSVIGPPGGGRRQGLVATLVGNAVRRRVTTLVGRLSTMRDFVWYQDVGRYLARAVLSEEESSRNSVQVLGSGRPATIHQVVRTVESVVGRRCYIRHSPVLTNASDITVSSAMLPPDWMPTDLRTCIVRIWRSSFE